MLLFIDFLYKCCTNFFKRALITYLIEEETKLGKENLPNLKANKARQDGMESHTLWTNDGDQFVIYSPQTWRAYNSGDSLMRKAGFNHSPIEVDNSLNLESRTVDSSVGRAKFVLLTDDNRFLTNAYMEFSTRDGLPILARYVARIAPSIDKAMKTGAELNSKLHGFLFNRSASYEFLNVNGNVLLSVEATFDENKYGTLPRLFKVVDGRVKKHYQRSK